MARLQQTIFDSLLVKLNDNEVLSVLLTDESNIATYQQMLNIFAGELAIVEQLFDTLITIVDDKVKEGIVGTIAWYGWTAKNVFQYTDTLVFNNGTGKYGYAIENDLLKIVSFASAENEISRVILKAAKEDSDGLAEVLTSSERTALQGFFDKYNFQKPVTVVSQAGDEVHLQASIEYDAAILGSSGESLVDTSVFPVEDAINMFYSSFQIQDNFANVFYVRKLEDAIQAVSGVVNVVITKCDIKPLGGSYNDVLATLFKKYNSAAGWVQEDSLQPLSSNLSYTAI